MDSACLYVLGSLGDLMIRPAAYGYLAWFGVWLLVLLGFLLQRGANLARRRPIRFLPVGICLLVLLYSEGRWNRWISFSGDGAGFLPTERLAAYALLFLCLPVLLGAILALVAGRLFTNRSGG